MTGWYTGIPPLEEEGGNMGWYTGIPPPPRRRRWLVGLRCVGHSQFTGGTCRSEWLTKVLNNLIILSQASGSQSFGTVAQLLYLYIPFLYTVRCIVHLVYSVRRHSSFFKQNIITVLQHGVQLDSYRLYLKASSKSPQKPNNIFL
jgi:hypothetical protein